MVHIEPTTTNGEPDADQLAAVDLQVDRITGAINGIMTRFHDLFSSFQFIQMSQLFSGVSPEGFMSNFNEQFNPEERIFEMVRRISEQEAQERLKKNKAQESAVKALAVISIEKKHMKAKDSKMEPPTCTICVEHIQLHKQGMFMPCGHIYHPDCLNPWLQTQNTCPVCRFALPKEEAS